MSPTIDDLPENVGDFGKEFNYEQWPPGTIAEFCNVPWNNDYRDLVRFPNRAALNSYLDKNVMENGGVQNRFTEMSYVKPNTPIRVNAGYNYISQFNYVRVRNETIVGDFRRDYYYFVVDIQQISTHTTGIYLQLDVWSTYFDIFSPGRGYLERGHYGMAAANSFRHYGRDFLTVPEGLDVGSDHISVMQEHERIAHAREAEINNASYGVAVWSTVNLAMDAGTVDDPKMNTARGSRFHNLPNGASMFYFDNAGEFIEWMGKASSTPWITQGIISVMAVPKLSRYKTLVGPIAVSTANSIKEVHYGILEPKQTAKLIRWRDSDAITNYLGRYRKLKKFLTYPYTAIEMTAYNGAPLLLKPELWDRDGTVMEVPHFALPSPRLVIYPKRYATTDAVPEVKDRFGAIINDGGEFLDVATGIFDFPTFSVVNNSYMSYMASNRNAIQYQHQSADWGQQKALQSNALGYNQATMGMSASNAQTGIGIGTANAQTALANQTQGYRSALGAANSIIGGIGNGQIGTAVMGAANAAADYAISTNQNTQSNAINTSAMSQSNRVSQMQQRFNRDTNKDYADFAARGDYANTIAGINAKIQDARMIQPTTSGQIGGDSFNLANWQWGYTLKVKMLQPNAMASIGEFWYRFGYAVQRFVQPPPDMHVMTHFSYWKFQEFYIKASIIPENIKQTIRGIFEKGVTVWRNPDDIATLDPSINDPISGITF